MPAAAVDVAFKARLRDNWTVGVVADGLNPGDPQNVTNPPDGVDAFLLVQYPVVNGEKPTIQRHYLEEGAARLVLSTKNGFDQPTVLAWTDALASLFRDRKFGGVETFTPSGPVVDDSNDDGAWVKHSLIVPYRYQFND